MASSFSVAAANSVFAWANAHRFGSTSQYTLKKTDNIGTLDKKLVSHSLQKLQMTPDERLSDNPGNLITYICFRAIFLHNSKTRRDFFHYWPKDYRRFHYNLRKDILSRTECILSGSTLQLKLISMYHCHGFRIQVEIRQALSLSRFQLKLISFLLFHN